MHFFFFFQITRGIVDVQYKIYDTASHNFEGYSPFSYYKITAYIPYSIQYILVAYFMHSSLYLLTLYYSTAPIPSVSLPETSFFFQSPYTCDTGFV